MSGLTVVAEEEDVDGLGEGQEWQAELLHVPVHLHLGAQHLPHDRLTPTGKHREAQRQSIIGD